MLPEADQLQRKMRSLLPDGLQRGTLLPARNAGEEGDDNDFSDYQYLRAYHALASINTLFHVIPYT